MPLTGAERSWVDAYRKALEKIPPGVMQRLVLFGSKARGDDQPDSDLDILLVIRNGAASWKRKLRRLGYQLAASGEALPSILVYTEAEWRKRQHSPICRAIERDQVSLL